MRTTPFQSMDEIDEYLSGDLIQCLECGKSFRVLTGKHLRLVHDTSPDEYRERWGIPKTYGLCGQAYSKERSEIAKRMIAEGLLTYEHLPYASDPLTRAPSAPRVKADLAAQSARAKRVRPGDHGKLPEGAIRANGRNADRAREYQQAFRALKANNPEVMQRYKDKYR